MKDGGSASIFLFPSSLKPFFIPIPGLTVVFRPDTISRMMSTVSVISRKAIVIDLVLVVLLVIAGAVHLF